MKRTNAARARQLFRYGEFYQAYKDERDIYNGYIDSCIELGEDPTEFLLENGADIKAAGILVQDIIDRIKGGLPKIEKDFIHFYYFEFFSFSETCKRLKVTQAQGAEIRRSALSHFDEIEGKHEEQLKEIFRGRIANNG